MFQLLTQRPEIRAFSATLDLALISPLCVLTVVNTGASSTVVCCKRRLEKFASSVLKLKCYCMSRALFQLKGLLLEFS